MSSGLEASQCKHFSRIVKHFCEQPSQIGRPRECRTLRALSTGRPDPVTLDDLARHPELKRQHELLLRFQRQLHLEPAVLGACALGSLADDRADRLSDVDLMVYCEPGAAEALLKTLSEVAADAPVVHRLNGRHDEASVFEKVILEDWSSYEIHVVEPQTRMRLRAPYVELLSRDGYLESVRRDDAKPIGPDTVKPYVNGDAGLVWDLYCCMKWLRRGDVDRSKDFLRQLGTRLNS